MKRKTILMISAVLILLTVHAGPFLQHLRDNYGRSDINTARVDNNAAEIGPDRSVTSLTLESKELQVDVDSKEARVTIDGTVFVDTTQMDPGSNLIFIDLTEKAEGLDTRISPSSLVVQHGQAGGLLFQVHIRVPANTTSTKEFTLRVWGNVSTTPGNESYTIGPAECVISIWRYFRIETFTKESNVTVKAGGSKTIDISLCNKGNGPDNVKLGIPGESALADRGIDFIKEEDWIYLEEGGSANTSIRISVDKDATAAVEYLDLWVVSRESLEQRGPGPAGEVNITLEITASGVLSSWYKIARNAIIVGIFILLGVNIILFVRKMKVNKK